MSATCWRVDTYAVATSGDRYADPVRDLFGLRDDASAAGRPPSVSGSPVRDAGPGSVSV